MDHQEGGGTFTIPEDDSVFFNPAMELNRDITVGVLTVGLDRFFSDRTPTYLDAMTGVGIRGIRAATLGYDVTVCDRNEQAVEVTRSNLDRNEITATVIQGDVRPHLYESRYDVVDLDPFGSPIPFVDPAVVGTIKLLCVTATDTAPLCGAHRNAGIRRYGAVPATTDDHPEIGLRVLLSALARTAAKYDVAVEPILSHSTRHYHRTYLAIETGATEADATLEDIGYLVHCEACREREGVHGLAPSLPSTCTHCGSSLTRIGPLWLGRYRDPTIVRDVIEALDERFGSQPRAGRLLTRLAKEADLLGHRDHHAICDRLDVPATPLDGVLDALRQADFLASRSHFGGTTFKTDAPVETIESIVAGLADSS